MTVHPARSSHSPAAYAALLLGVAGFGLLLLGWLGTSGRAEFSDQKGYVLLAALGLLVTAAGATVGLSLQRRRLTDRSEDLAARMGAWLEELVS
jgi:hypothetical protein